jgi:EAL domain-containing protein (putative c-di-GMP-specific phosphodiesterase class I)
MALYRAKIDGRDSYRFFEPDMDARMQARRTMEIDLRRALTIGEFEVYYQPLITLKTEKISGFEALLRWHHPERGMVPPLEFIPVAEEIGLIGQIGAWVLKQACLEAAKWPDDIHIAVNLSPAQFRDRAVVLDVVAALGVSGLPAHRLEIEITESVLLQDTQSNLAILGELRDLGVGISMDDFGTGYSSLAYLQKFSFHKIKIDRSFVSELERPESIAIIRAVMGLGNSLGMKTTAEGVETEEQLETLKKEGCTEVQGYLFSKPVPAAQAALLLRGLKATKAIA